jgi:hypothetical protein
VILNENVIVEPTSGRSNLNGHLGAKIRKVEQFILESFSFIYEIYNIVLNGDDQKYSSDFLNYLAKYRLECWIFLIENTACVLDLWNISEIWNHKM